MNILGQKTPFDRMIEDFAYNEYAQACKERGLKIPDRVEWLEKIENEAENDRD